MHKHARLEIRWSQMAFEAICGWKPSCSSYMAGRVLYSRFGCPCMHC